MTTQDALEVAEWRRDIAQLYATVRTMGGERAAWEVWRSGKEKLYRDHPQSPVPVAERARYAFTCFDHDPALRVLAVLEPTDPVLLAGAGEVPAMTRVGLLAFDIAGVSLHLPAFWLDGYAGGMFVPVADATSGIETYGGGRYVLDTAKGADLGLDEGRVVLDFNYAFAPSCAHDPRWTCPLAQPGSRLPIAVRGGERSAA